MKFACKKLKNSNFALYNQTLHKSRPRRLETPDLYDSAGCGKGVVEAPLVFTERIGKKKFPCPHHMTRETVGNVFAGCLKNALLEVAARRCTIRPRYPHGDAFYVGTGRATARQ